MDLGDLVGQTGFEQQRQGELGGHRSVVAPLEPAGAVVQDLLASDPIDRASGDERELASSAGSRKPPETPNTPAVGPRSPRSPSRRSKYARDPRIRTAAQRARQTR